MVGRVMKPAMAAITLLCVMNDGTYLSMVVCFQYQKELGTQT